MLQGPAHSTKESTVIWGYGEKHVVQWPNEKMIQDFKIKTKS